MAATGLVLSATVACDGGALLRQYEYEEEMYLTLDGKATVYVNSSIAALNGLRGTSFDASPNAPVDRNAVREYFTTPITHVTGSVGTSRRNNRRFVHVRVDVDDVRRLNEAVPFAWSTCSFMQDGNLFVYRQDVGAPAGNGSGAPNWTGQELVAFRLHLPSKIRFHNAGEGNLRRGNILVWEQTLQDRLGGAPVVLEARMDNESILYRTLYLFGVTFAAVAAMFVLIIWWVFRRGARQASDARSPARRAQSL